MLEEYIFEDTSPPPYIISYVSIIVISFLSFYRGDKVFVRSIPTFLFIVNVL